MISRLAHGIYVSNLTTVMIAMPIVLIAWSVIAAALDRWTRLIGAVMAAVFAAAILYLTVFSRSPAKSETDLVPFSSFERAIIQPEMYRSLLMNVLLFFPLGLFLPFVFRGKIAKRILLTILIGFLLSAAIETLQYLLLLGMAEADDLLFNTLGAPKRVWALEAVESKKLSVEQLDGLMDDILNGGNFGTKDMNRYREIKYISDRGENTVSKNGILSQAFQSMNHKVRADYRTLGRYKLLMPIGYLAEMVKYTGLLAAGKRKSSGSKAMLREAKARKNLYRNLKLFEA
jgi:VanZ family protein